MHLWSAGLTLLSAVKTMMNIDSSMNSCEGVTECQNSSSAGLLSPFSSRTKISSVPALVDALDKVYLYLPGPNNWKRRKVAIECLLNNFEMSEDEMSRYAHFSDKFPYTRNMVSTDGENYTLLLLCWNSEMESKVHNHPCDGCFVKSLAGEVMETKYADPAPGEKSMPMIAETLLSRGQVTYMDDYVGYHKVGNPGKIPAVTMHLYTPPYHSCKVWATPDDVESNFEGKVSYYSEFGKLIDISKVSCCGGNVLTNADTADTSSPGSPQLPKFWNCYI